MSPFSVRSATPADAASVARLLSAQADWLEAMDSRLRMPRAAGPGGLVAVDPSGAVAGHLRPMLIEIPAGDEVLSFAAPRTVHWQEVVMTDLAALDGLRRAAAVPDAAEGVLWPAADAGAAFLAAGLAAAFVFALRPPEPLHGGAAVAVRRARQEDTESLVALHDAEVGFHEPYTSFIRRVPGLGPAYRTRLERVWAGGQPTDGSSVIHVAEVDGEVVAMCESMLQVAPTTGAASRLPQGRYGYLNSVSVAAAHRGSGVGRSVVAAALGELAAYGVDGYTLWYAAGNPLASRVWPHLGFRPLWTQYERRG